jgi:hypothetical protein
VAGCFKDGNKITVFLLGEFLQEIGFMDLVGLSLAADSV